MLQVFTYLAISYFYRVLNTYLVVFCGLMFAYKLQYKYA